MARLLPLRSPVEGRGSEPRVVGIDDAAADEVFSALSSGTGRELLAALYEEPRTASDLADEADTSLQNARYHIEKLTDAGLVEVVDTWYSDRGTEMKVYAPTDTSLVVFAGDDADRTTLLEMVKRVLGAVGVLGVASLLVERLATGGLLPTAGSGAGGADGGGGPGGANEDAAPSTVASGGDSGAGDTAAEGTYADDATTAGTREPTESGATVATEEPSATDGAATETARASATEGDATTTAAETATEATTTPTEVATTAVRATTETAGTAEAAVASPGLLFFAGGLLVVALAVGWWTLNR